MPDDKPPPNTIALPHHSGEVTASARAKPRPVSSLLNEPHDVDAADIRSFDDGHEGTGQGAARPFVSTFSPSSTDSDDGASTADDDDNAPGDDSALPPRERPFGEYELLRRLAFGGMGEVFLARRRSDVGIDLGMSGLARLVVVKRVLAHMRRDDKHRRMFLDEASLQTRLKSPHIVQIHDVGDHDGLVFLAMEHVHGPSWRGLVDRCRKRRQHIPVAYVVEMMIQACAGLSYAHNLVDDDSGLPLKVVHRDINPHNVLVTYDGVVKLIDFGIAKSELREQQTETGTIKGKFSYMSPEQSAAEPLDARSDLFALGICLYELLTLTNPFKRSNIVLSLEAIQKTTPKSLATVRPGAAILAPVTERMLRKNPDDRFFDCADVATALRQLLVDGLIPEAKVPLSTWLRELYADEIAEHHRVLELTREPVEHTTTTTRPTVTIPPRAALVSTPSHEPVTRSAPRAARPRAPTPAPQLLSSPLLGDGASTNPTGAAVAQPRQTPLQRQAALIGVVVGVAVAAVVVGAWALLREPTSTAIVDAGVVLPVKMPAITPPVDAGSSVVVVVVDAGAAVVAAVDAGVVAVDGDGDIVIAHPDTPRPQKQTPKTVVAPTAVARVVVTAEGFVVKGNRTVTADGVTLLSVDDADAPFTLKLRITDVEGEGRLTLDSSPWAIVRVDQVGRGRTPLSDLVLKPGRKTLISLQNPTGAKMDLNVSYAPSR